MDAFRNHASQWRDQVAKQQQAVLKQFSSCGYGNCPGSDAFITNEAELQHHKLEKLYNSARAGKHFERDIVRGVEHLIVAGSRQTEVGTRLCDDCAKFASESPCARGVLGRAAFHYGTVRAQVERERDFLNRGMSNQVTLYKWYLIRCNHGHNVEVAVGGFLTPELLDIDRRKTTPIVERLEKCKLWTKDEVEVNLIGLIDERTTLLNGFSLEIVHYFISGFPYIWNHILSDWSVGNTMDTQHTCLWNCPLRASKSMLQESSKSEDNQGMHTQETRRFAAQEESLPSIPAGRTECCLEQDMEKASAAVVLENSNVAGGHHVVEKKVQDSAEEGGISAEEGKKGHVEIVSSQIFLDICDHVEPLGGQSKDSTETVDNSVKSLVAERSGEFGVGESVTEFFAEIIPTSTSRTRSKKRGMDQDGFTLAIPTEVSRDGEKVQKGSMFAVASPECRKRRNKENREAEDDPSSACPQVAVEDWAHNNVDKPRIYHSDTAIDQVSTADPNDTEAEISPGIKISGGEHNRKVVKRGNFTGDDVSFQPARILRRSLRKSIVSLDSALDVQDGMQRQVCGLDQEQGGITRSSSDVAKDIEAERNTQVAGKQTERTSDLQKVQFPSMAESKRKLQEIVQKGRQSYCSNKSSPVIVLRRSSRKSIRSLDSALDMQDGTEGQACGLDQEQDGIIMSSSDVGNDIEAERKTQVAGKQTEQRMVQCPSMADSKKKLQEIVQHGRQSRSILPPPLPTPRVPVSKRLISAAFGLKTSRSGRLLVPPLQYWRSETLAHDMDGGIIAILNGREESVKLDTGRFNFKLPSEAQAIKLQERLRAAATEILTEKKSTAGKRKRISK